MLGNHIYFGAILTCGGTAIIVRADLRLIIGEYIHGNNISNLVYLNVVVVPFESFRPLSVIHMTENHHTVLVSDSRFSGKISAHNRCKITANVFGGAGLLFGEQCRHPEAKPSFSSKSHFNRNGIHNDFFNHFVSSRVSGICRKHPREQGCLFGNCFEFQCLVIGSLDVVCFQIPSNSCSLLVHPFDAVFNSDKHLIKLTVLIHRQHPPVNRS